MADPDANFTDFVVDTTSYGANSNFAFTNLNTQQEVTFTEGVTDAPALVTIGQDGTPANMTGCWVVATIAPSRTVCINTTNPRIGIFVYGDDNGPDDTANLASGLGTVAFNNGGTPANVYIALVLDTGAPATDEEIEVELFIFSAVNSATYSFNTPINVAQHDAANGITAPRAVPTAFSELIRREGLGSISIISDRECDLTGLLSPATPTLSTLGTSVTALANGNAVYTGIVTTSQIVTYLNSQHQGAVAGTNADFINIAGLRYSLGVDGDNLVVENMYYTDIRGVELTLVSGRATILPNYTFVLEPSVDANAPGAMDDAYAVTGAQLYGRIIANNITVNADNTLTYTAPLLTVDTNYAGAVTDTYIVPPKVTQKPVLEQVRIASQPSVYL